MREVYIESGLIFIRDFTMVRKPRTFQSKTTFQAWLRRSNYTKDASPGSGVYNSKGKRIGGAFEIAGKGNKRKVVFDKY